MELEETRRNWEQFGREDPLWAILTSPDRKHNRWDVEEFFRTGEAEIARLFERLSALGLPVGRSRCLDFGCGVGRVSQALCSYFDRCDGVDIAQSMIDRARSFNRFGDRCRYHVSTSDDLGLFSDACFDLVYTNAVLQHMEPGYALKYVAEFVRLLARGGVAVFEAPSSYTPLPPLPDGAHRAAIELVSEPPRVMAPAGRAELAVRVTNLGDARWPWLGAPNQLQLGNHWRSADGSRIVTFDDGRAGMPSLMEPGDQAVFHLQVTAPPARSTYRLEIDMVEEGVTWFAERGSATYSTLVSCHETLASAAKRGIKRMRRRAVTTSSPTRDRDEPVMEMHCIPSGEVVAAVAAAGGEVVHLDTYDAIGDGHTTCRYVVRRGRPPGRAVASASTTAPGSDADRSCVCQPAPASSDSNDQPAPVHQAWRDTPPGGS
jgi:SAM-dependent methyltransferase